MNNVEKLRLYAPDADALADELGVYKRAREAALVMSIGSDDIEPDNHQKTIYLSCLERMRRTYDEVRRMLDDGRDLRAERASYNPLGKLKSCYHNFDSAVKHATFDRRSELKTAAFKVHKLDTQLWAMKGERDLQRDPQPPGNLGFAVTLLVVALIGETLINGILFARGSEMGYLGGVTQALFISLVNLVLSFGAGYLLKNRNKWHGWQRHGFTAALLGGQQGVIGLVNLCAAHYRSAVVVLDSFEAANRQFLTNVFTKPLQIETFESFVLLVLGVAIAQFMLYKGYTFGDVDREYGKLGRQLTEAEDEYAHLKMTVEQEIKRARREADAAVDAVVLKFREIISEYESSLTLSADLVECYARIASEWESTQQVLIRRFRAYLESAPRSTPFPRYWSQFEKFPEKEMHIIVDLTRDSDRLEQLYTLAEKVMEEAQEMKERIHKREAQETEELERFFAEIKGQAERELREKEAWSQQAANTAQAGSVGGAEFTSGAEAQFGGNGGATNAAGFLNLKGDIHESMENT